jgi:2-dehydro-3-deoxyphosphogluconate aldolase/(4S)-4-hydroxy-2-oxoglutarate aldolase
MVKIEKTEDALPQGRALIDGDLPIAEITFRISAAEESIKILTKKLPDLLVGAGTVLTVGQTKKQFLPVINLLFPQVLTQK